MQYFHCIIIIIIVLITGIYPSLNEWNALKREHSLLQQHHQNNLQKSLSRTDSHYRELTTNQQFNERQFSMSSPIETPSNKFWSSSFSHVHSLSPSLSCPIPLEIREWNKSTTHYNDKNKSSLIHSLQSEINRLSEENLVRHQYYAI